MKETQVLELVRLMNQVLAKHHLCLLGDVYKDYKGVQDFFEPEIEKITKLITSSLERLPQVVKSTSIILRHRNLRSYDQATLG